MTDDAPRAARLRHSRRRPYLSIAALLVLAGAPTAHAACSRPVAAAYTTPLAASMFAAAPGVPSLPDAIAALSGCTLVVRVLPTARVWASFDSGDVDLVFGAMQTAARDKVADFVPMTMLPVLLVTQRPPGSVPDRLEDYGPHHLPVGLVRGVHFSGNAETAIEALRKQGLIDEATDRDEAYRKLEGGRDAAVIADVRPDDRPEHATLRVLVQTQFAPLVNGTYLRRAALDDGERRHLDDAIAQATAERIRVLPPNGAGPSARVSPRS